LLLSQIVKELFSVRKIQLLVAYDNSQLILTFRPHSGVSTGAGLSFLPGFRKPLRGLRLRQSGLDILVGDRFLSTRLAHFFSSCLLLAFIGLT